MGLRAVISRRNAVKKPAIVLKNGQNWGYGPSFHRKRHPAEFEKWPNSAFRAVISARGVLLKIQFLAFI